MSLFLTGLACSDGGGPNPSPVTITAISPSTGPLAGGTSVTITGTNFTDVTSVTVGGSELSGRTVVRSTQIIGSTPVSGSAGAKDVVVTSRTHGSGTCTGCFTYAEDEPPTLRFTALSLGDHYTCGLTSEGSAYCWGDNQRGQLGLGTTAGPDRCFSETPCSTLPRAVSGGATFASLTAGGGHTCALTAAGTAYCWGSNRYAQLGIGTAPASCEDVSACFSSAPAPVTGGLSFVSLSISGGSTAHTCGLTADGAAYCWGLNQGGELGTGSADGPEFCPADIAAPPRPCSTVPVPVTGGLRFASVSIGGGHNCGLTAEQAAYCWGPSGFDERERLTPELVPGGLSFAMLRVSISHVCGFTTAGDPYCWGYNRFGRLGDGSPEETIRQNPGPVVGGLKFSAISVASSHSCALTTAGAAYCWGHGGALGDGTSITRFTPVPVQGGLTFTAVSVGRGHTCGITTAGDAYCWGDNQSGQLGNGTLTASTVPVKVAGQ